MKRGRKRIKNSWCNRARKAGMNYQTYRYKHDKEYRKHRIELIMKCYTKHRDKRIAYMNKYNQLRKQK